MNDCFLLPASTVNSCFGGFLNGSRKSQCLDTPSNRPLLAAKCETLDKVSSYNNLIDVFWPPNLCGGLLATSTLLWVCRFHLKPSISLVSLANGRNTLFYKHIEAHNHTNCVGKCKFFFLSKVIFNQSSSLIKVHLPYRVAVYLNSPSSYRGWT